jgi:hypothetical protein
MAWNKRRNLSQVRLVPLPENDNDYRHHCKRDICTKVAHNTAVGSAYGVFIVSIFDTIELPSRRCIQTAGDALVDESNSRADSIHLESLIYSTLTGAVTSALHHLPEGLDVAPGSTEEACKKPL